MTDREQVIATLTEHLDHWKRLLSEGICCEVEGEKTINALTFAIESIKVDRAYELMHEKVDFIEIPEKATNGDMIKAMFPKAWRSNYIDSTNKFTLYIDDDYELEVDNDWWNSPYRKEN